MLKFGGKGVYGAYAFGRAKIFKRLKSEVKRIEDCDPEKEFARVKHAEEEAEAELAVIHEKAMAEVGDENARIFKVHMIMLNDIDYNTAIKKILDSEHVNAEYAVKTAAHNFSRMFAAMDDEYMQGRAADIKDISHRVINCLMGSEDEAVTGDDGMVICADDLAPSETISLDKDRVLAFVTSAGSFTSHTAILARNMNIPAVVSLGNSFLSKVKDGDMLIVDGYKGRVIVDPDEETLAEYRKKQEEDNEKKKLVRRLKGKDNVTIDGRRIDIFANISSVNSVDKAIENDAGGIGLFRSEFLYLESNDYPTEDMQFNAYKKVLKKMEGKKVIIRTMDIGADKQIDYFGLEKEENPALGMRAIRICLARPELFKTQLRALFRASVYGNLGIMFPMITSVNEVERILAICDEVKAELAAEGAGVAENVELGIMIETPAAAIMSDLLAPMVDFFSIGTNDLTQYTLATDRQNPILEEVAVNGREAVLRLIKIAADNAHRHGKWVGMCGELAADTSLTEEFIKMGIDELSVSSSFVLPLREKVRSLNLSS